MTQLYEIPHSLPAGTDQPLLGVESSPTYEIAPDPTVRVATLDDVSALAQVELYAYSDVYGSDPDEDTVAQAETKYRERIELLGDLVTVLEKPGIGVYGVLVACTTDMEREDFTSNDHDMTDNEAIRGAYNPHGKNAYVVNLAILPEHQGNHDSGLLFIDAIVKGQARGVERAYFQSRLPEFEAWRDERIVAIMTEGTGAPVPTEQQLAEEYWQATDEAGNPVDPLLRMYVELGASPLMLVKDAWKPDRPSSGYGVLFEYDLRPASERTPIDVVDPQISVEDIGLPAAESVDQEVLIAGEDGSKVMDFMRGTARWIRQHKVKSALLGSAVAGIAYVAAQGGESQILDEVRHNAEWVVPAYLGSLGVYVGGAAMMLGAAGKKIFSNLRNVNQQLPDLVQDNRANRVLRAGFYVNFLGGVAAASVASAGIIETLPPQAWTTLAIPIIDLYSTIVSRSILARPINKQGHSTASQ